MEALGCEWSDDARWGRVMRYQGQDGPVTATVAPHAANDKHPDPLPAWLFAKAPDEARPPRPLTPSQLVDDDYGDAPPSAFMLLAAEKGRLIHALFERISGKNLARTMQYAQSWLLTNNRNPGIDNDAILSAIRSVVEDRDCAPFFKAEAQAEVPLAAVVGETVITGRVDRLVVEPAVVRVLDFKTGRNVPENADAVSVPFLRQMAHYVAALEVIFPGHSVEASLIYTHAPKHIILPSAILAPYKPLP
jgi:ATP-dependent helicase/nuclease subunit A